MFAHCALVIEITAQPKQLMGGCYWTINALGHSNKGRLAAENSMAGAEANQGSLHFLHSVPRPQFAFQRLDRRESKKWSNSIFREHS
jgi:hypothetical protein